MVSDPTHNEKDWLAALKNGDKHAFRSIYNQYYKYLVVTAFNILGDRDLARDLAQDVFCGLWQKRETLLITSSLKPYLRRAVVNKTLNHIKASRIDFDDPVNLHDPPSGTPGADKKLEAAELEKLIHEAISKLPERCRMIFTLCRLEKLSHREIAERLGISNKTVENQMTRALAMLRKTLSPYVADGTFIWFLGMLADYQV